MLKPYYTKKGDNVKPVQTIVTDTAENDCNFDENFDVHSGTAKIYYSCFSIIKRDKVKKCIYCKRYNIIVSINVSNSE